MAYAVVFLCTVKYRMSMRMTKACECNKTSLKVHSKRPSTSIVASLSLTCYFCISVTSCFFVPSVIHVEKKPHTHTQKTTV